MKIVTLEEYKVTDDYVIDEEVEIQIEDFEIDLEEIEIGEVETDNYLAKNIIKTSKMLIELTDKNTKYYEDNLVFRPRFEVNGGIKNAQKKGARVKEVKIFNQFFRFINKKFDGFNTTGINGKACLRASMKSG